MILSEPSEKCCWSSAGAAGALFGTSFNKSRYLFSRGRSLCPFCALPLVIVPGWFNPTLPCSPGSSCSKSGYLYPVDKSLSNRAIFLHLTYFGQNVARPHTSFFIQSCSFCKLRGYIEIFTHFLSAGLRLIQWIKLSTL